MLKTSAILCTFILPQLCFIILYLFFKHKFNDFYRNFTRFNGYHFYSLLLLTVVLVSCQVYKSVVRVLQPLVYIILMVIFLYLESWCLGYVNHPLVFDQKLFIVISYLLLTQTIGLFLNCLISQGSDFNPIVGVIIGLFLNLMAFITVPFTLRWFNPKLHEYMAYSFFAMLIGAYLNFDL